MNPTLIVNPITDREFVAAAEEFVTSGAQTTEDLESLLRVRYPRAVVHARELSGEPVTVWYVYRDGRWTNARPSG
jgi:hypothetical protein